MARMDNLQIIKEALAGARPVDEQTHAAMAILAERLERLKHSSSVFADIAFSPHVKKLQRQAEALVLG